MKPSVFGSFVVFVIIMVFTFIENPPQAEQSLRTILILSAVFSALNYYYLNVAAENHFKSDNDSPTVAICTWWITAIQFGVLGSLWFLLRHNWIYYAAGLAVLNLSYLLWDLLHRKKVVSSKEGEIMRLFDFFGTAAAVWLFIATFEGLPRASSVDSIKALDLVWVTVPASVVAALALASLAITWIIFKYNPFRMLNMDGEPIVNGNSNGAKEDE